MAFNKVINSESQKFQPVTTETLVLDAVPTVNSFNSVTSDAVARAVAGASGEVPQVTENDNGKVLKAIYDEGGPAVEWGEATVDQTYDPTSTNAQAGVAVAEAISGISVDEVPEVTSEDDGKVLTASYSGGQGSYSWQTAQGGVDVGQDNVVLTGDGDSIKIEFTRVTDTSSTIIEHTNLTGTTNTGYDYSYSGCWCCYLAFDLDSVNKAIDAGSNPLLKITSSISVAQNKPILLGFSDITTTISGSGVGVIRESPLSVQDISIKSKINDIITSSNTLRYFVVQIPAPSDTEASAQELAATVASDISIEGWPVDGYGTKAVIPALPDYSSADAGRVLQVQNDGTLAWVTLS